MDILKNFDSRGTSSYSLMTNESNWSVLKTGMALYLIFDLDESEIAMLLLLQYRNKSKIVTLCTVSAVVGRYLSLACNFILEDTFL